MRSGSCRESRSRKVRSRAVRGYVTVSYTHLMCIRDRGQPFQPGRCERRSPGIERGQKKVVNDSKPGMDRGQHKGYDTSK